MFYHPHFHLFVLTDRRGAVQRLCRGVEYTGELPWPNDRSQVLGGKMYEPRVVVRADESTYNQENGIDIRHHRQVSYFCTFAVRFNPGGGCKGGPGLSNFRKN